MADPRDEETKARIYGLPGAAERAADRALYEATLKQIVLGDPVARESSERLRALVEGDLWHLPLGAEGAFELIEAEAGRYRLAVGPEPVPSTKGKRRRHGGKGGVLLPVFFQAAEGGSVSIDGRALARSIPAGVDGLLVHFPDDRPREVGREHFEELLSLAGSCDLEDLLGNAGLDQVEKLNEATWWVARRHGVVEVDAVETDARVVSAYTHPDRSGWSRSDLVSLKGRELFEMVVSDEDLDGIVVNGTGICGRGEHAINRLALSVGILHGFLVGDDRRPGAQPLPARSRKEVELWLELRGFELRGFVWKDRELIEAPYPEESLIRARTGHEWAREWRMQETLGTQRGADGTVWSPVFVVPAAGLQESGFGPGATRILCAGLLAKALGAGHYDAKDPEKHWRPGRSLLVGRRQSAWDRERSQRRVELAEQLLRLVPEGAERIPRSALLAVKGAGVLRRYPYAGTRAWIEGTLLQAQRCTRPWVWNGG
jgi:hypothetical protein